MRTSVTERVYFGVKAIIISGQMVPGTRIDASQLTLSVTSSITPVRLALSRLVGENLVELHANEGYYMPRVTEPGLRDLYDWNQHLAQMALRHRSERAEPANSCAEIRATATSDLIAATESFFLLLGRLAENSEVLAAIASCNARLRAVRHLKNGMIADRESELLEMVDHLETGKFSELGRSLSAYHKKRKEAVPWLVRRLHELA